MTTQGRLWGPADTATRQGRLFADDGPRESTLSCECGEPLVRTQSGYLTCPRGCGKLREDVTEGESGSWFDFDTTDGD